MDRGAGDYGRRGPGSDEIGGFLVLFKVRREAINTLAVTVALVLIVTLALYLRLKFVFTIDHPP